MNDIDFKEKTKALIDSLKSISANYGLGNDGNEFKIITQVFLYKFMNDKFAFDLKKLDPKLKNADNWEETVKSYSDDDYEMLRFEFGRIGSQLQQQHFVIVFGV